MAKPEWITTREAAQLSGYHVERVRELLREGKVLGEKFGTVWQVNKTSMLDYLRQMQKLGERRGPKPRND